MKLSEGGYNLNKQSEEYQNFTKNQSKSSSTVQISRKCFKLSKKQAHSPLPKSHSPYQNTFFTFFKFKFLCKILHQIVISPFFGQRHTFQQSEKNYRHPFFRFKPFFKVFDQGHTFQLSEKNNNHPFFRFKPSF